MTTKEKIIMAALDLFSIKGYHGTSVKNIADKVGIKDSSLYKHFKSKQDIFDTITDIMMERISHMSHSTGIPENCFSKDAIAFYKYMNAESLKAYTRNVFLFYLKDPYISGFWRISNMEQYHNPYIFNIYREFFMEKSITYQTDLFSQLIKHGILIDADPQVMAMSYYTPIFFLLHKYNSAPRQENEALELLDKQVEEFLRIYSVNKEN